MGQDFIKKGLTWIAIAGGIGVIAFLVIFSPENIKSKNTARPLAQPVGASPNNTKPDTSQLQGLEFFPDEGQEHVPDGTRVLYKTDPPTSGRHYDKWLPPGVVYEKDKTVTEKVVHNLEHGNVVIYMDPDQVAENEREALIKLSGKYTGQWDGVILITQKGIASPVILTAWRTTMPLPKYNEHQIDAFLNAFRGRGPENPIR